MFFANRNYVPIGFIVLDIGCNPTCPIILGRAWQPMVGWLEGLWYPQPIRVQILMLVFIPGFILGFSAMRIQWEETFLSTTRCLRLHRKFQDDIPTQSFGGAHRGRVCVCAFIGVSVCACI